MNFKNKVVVVTGGNSGIGRATALAFAREGAKVVIAARNVERGNGVVKELQQSGGEAIFVPTNVAEAKQIEALIATTVARSAPMGSLYSAAKAGILGLSKSAAMEYGKQGIRINILVAGAFEMPMLNNAINRSSGESAEARQKTIESFSAMIGAGRIGNPDEAAQAIVWLCHSMEQHRRYTLILSLYYARFGSYGCAATRVASSTGALARVTGCSRTISSGAPSCM